MKRTSKTRKNNKKVILGDPNMSASPAEVMDSYPINYPELTTATVYGPEVEDSRTIYEFKTTTGVRGQGHEKGTT